MPHPKHRDCGHNPTNGYICDDCWYDLPFGARWITRHWDRSPGGYGPPAGEWFEFMSACESHWSDRPL
jgi:hypothetical protein